MDSIVQNPSSATRNSLEKVVIAIPAFNEGERIAGMLQKCVGLGVETWVIDDGSVDQTFEQSRQAGARVFRHPKNLGKGMAIRTAIGEFLKTDRNYLALMDADGQHDPSDLPSFVEAAQKSGCGIVLGNRMGSWEKMPSVRRWTNQVMSQIVSLLAGQEIPDSQCGFRLLGREFAGSFRPTTSHFELESEMLVQAGRFGIRMESVPIATLYEGQTSHIHPVRDTLRFLKFLVRELFYSRALPAWRIFSF